MSISPLNLYEIQPDGTGIVLWSDTRRLRYRDSLREAKLVKPGEIVRCDFNPGLFVARRLMKGSRLRLVVSSPNSTQLAKELLLGRSRRRRNGARTRAPATCRCIMTPPIPARFNFRCDDPLRSWNFGHHGHGFTAWDTGARRFGNRDRNPLSASGGHEPFAISICIAKTESFCGN